MKQSPQRRRELALHSKLKRELIDQYGECCQTCGSTGDWRGISLSHIIALGRGGKTERGNVLLEDYICHTRYEKKPELREQEHPELFEKFPELRRL